LPGTGFVLKIKLYGYACLNKTTSYRLENHSLYYEAGDEKAKVPAYMGESPGTRETPFGKSFGHGGNNGDFRCKFEVYNAVKMGYVIFTNSNKSDAMLEDFCKFLVEGEDTP
jgi:hypothetical protein